jgi:hypothetical protein
MLPDDAACGLCNAITLAFSAVDAVSSAMLQYEAQQPVTPTDLHVHAADMQSARGRQQHMHRTSISVPHVPLSMHARSLP